MRHKALISTIVLVVSVFFTGHGCYQDSGTEDPSTDTDTDSDSDSDSDSDTDTDTDTDTDSDSNLSCFGLSFDECSKQQSDGYGCRAVEARRIDAENECIETENTYAGCATPYSPTCGYEDAMAFAIEPETGDCYWFNQLCFPDHWEVDMSTIIPYDHPACAPGFNDYYEAVYCS